MLSVNPYSASLELLPLEVKCLPSVFFLVSLCFCAFSGCPKLILGLMGNYLGTCHCLQTLLLVPAQCLRRNCFNWFASKKGNLENHLLSFGFHLECKPQKGTLKRYTLSLRLPDLQQTSCAVPMRFLSSLKQQTSRGAEESPSLR